MIDAPFEQRRSPKRLTAIYCTAVLVFIALVLTMACGWDQPVVVWFNQHAHKPAKAVATFISQTGDYPILACLSIVALAIAAFAKHPIAKRMILVMLITASVAGLLANTIRVLTGRARPNATVAPGWYGPSAAIHNDRTHQFQSFPSAHTSVMAGFAIPLILAARRRWIAAVAGLSVIAMALARMTLGVHHLSDVLAAILVGMIATWIVSLLAQRFRRRKESCDL